MNSREVDEWLRKIAKEAVDKWFKEQCENPYEHFYLYYRQGEILICNFSPNIFDDGVSDLFSLAHPQRISPSWTGPMAESFVIETMRKLPCLPNEF